MKAQVHHFVFRKEHVGKINEVFIVNKIATKFKSFSKFTLDLMLDNRNSNMNGETVTALVCTLQSLGSNHSKENQ